VSRGWGRASERVHTSEDDGSVAMHGRFVGCPSSLGLYILAALTNHSLESSPGACKISATTSGAQTLVHSSSRPSHQRPWSESGPSSTLPSAVTTPVGASSSPLLCKFPAHQTPRLVFELFDDKVPKTCEKCALVRWLCVRSSSCVPAPPSVSEHSARAKRASPPCPTGHSSTRVRHFIAPSKIS